MVENFNIDKLVRDNVKGLSPYSSARDEYVSDGSKMIFLDANENPFDNGVNRYPDPQQRSLKAVLATQKKVAPAQILLGNGSDEVLDLLFRAFCEPKTDNIISLPPTYGMYKVLSGINNIENREVLLTESFEPNVAEILRKSDQNSKLLFLCSPNNPTGNSFSKAVVKELLQSFKGLVVVDEAYIDFSPEDSWIHGLEEYPNLVVTQTLSKAYGMAGIRLGICYASTEIIAVLNKIKPPYNVNELSQHRAYERLMDQEAINQEITAILEQRDCLSKALLELPYVDRVFPSHANFILAKVDDANNRYEKLLAKGVVIRNRTTQPLCENTLRFTVGTPVENEQLIRALKEIQ
ncbi:histidinol-phosphate aminotransferase [Arenibacter nanhaiticus]|uniref:Histidinol-phosphate aminotransferase n=1 Tax=Arenibacter nanhaiticus TaxID=558155 RepID=A0A1M6FWJ7_9FLAO|nr:histidinol-phosphate transaminase [Arenibacter nanhaiticus]SHJ02034.1 histidinol-phosphate aminotransferase [Arenibacter nanhaiticus]